MATKTFCDLCDKECTMDASGARMVAIEAGGFGKKAKQQMSDQIFCGDCTKKLRQKMAEIVTENKGNG